VTVTRARNRIIKLLNAGLLPFCCHIYTNEKYFSLRAQCHVTVLLLSVRAKFNVPVPSCFQSENVPANLEVHAWTLCQIYGLSTSVFQPCSSHLSNCCICSSTSEYSTSFELGTIESLV